MPIFAPLARYNPRRPFSVGKGCVFCCFLLVYGPFISAAGTFLTAIDLRKLRRFGAFLAPFFSLAFVVGTSHHDDAKTLLARVGATSAKLVVAAPSGVWI